MEHFTILPLVQPNPFGLPVNISEIERLCNKGLSECPPEDRCLAWLVLLGVYPKDASEWPQKLEKMECDYKSFIDDLNLQDWLSCRVPEIFSDFVFPVPNNDLMSIIHGDIIRSLRQMLFLPPSDEVSESEKDLSAPFVTHIRRIERMLYIFGTFNSSYKYIQGFNELIIPCYFVCIQAAQMFHDDMIVVEAITFFLFENLLMFTNVREYFQSADQSKVTIQKLAEFEKLFARHAPNQHSIIAKQRIQPLIYAFRWFNILFAQEYDLPSLLVIWDSLLAHHSDLIGYAYYIGIAQMLLTENTLNESQDFTTVLQSLQNIKISNVYQLISVAESMWYKDNH